MQGFPFSSVKKMPKYWYPHDSNIDICFTHHCLEAAIVDPGCEPAVNIMTRKVALNSKSFSILRGVARILLYPEILLVVVAGRKPCAA